MRAPRPAPILSSSPGASPVSAIDIQALRASPKTHEMLSEMLIETVAHGGSVTFLHPLDAAVAGGFLLGAPAGGDRGERIVRGAFDGDILAGTVSLILDMPPNQLHRAEIAKLMTRPISRGRGVASGLPKGRE